MSTKQHDFTLETALAVVQHPTVDSQLWSNAVEWLLLHGPPRVREVLLYASQDATSTQFPALTPAGFTPEGEPFYRIDELARTLDRDEEEIREVLERKQQGLEPPRQDDGTETVH